MLSTRTGLETRDTLYETDRCDRIDCSPAALIVVELKTDDVSPKSTNCADIAEKESVRCTSWGYSCEDNTHARTGEIEVFRAGRLARLAVNDRRHRIRLHLLQAHVNKTGLK